MQDRRISSPPPKITPVSVAADTGQRVDGSTTVNQFVLGDHGSVKDIHSLLTLNAQQANSSVVVDDSRSTTTDIVTVANGMLDVQVGMAKTDQFFGTGGGLDCNTIGSLTLDLSRAAGDVAHVTPSTVTALVINGDPSEYQAGTGAELDLDLTGTTGDLLTPNGPGSGKWTFGNRQPVSFTNISVQKH